MLDAARNDADAKRGRNVRIPKGPRVAQKSFGGLGSASSLSASTEVERRKRARRNRAIRMWAVVAVVVVALVGAGAYFGYRLYQDRDDFTGRFDALIGQFADIDKTMVKVDALMVDPINSVEADERAAVLEEFARTESALARVVADARTLQEDPIAPQDDPVFSSVESSALARQKMLEAAADAFKLSEIANKQVSSTNRAWEEVLAGDGTAREATEMANAASTEASTLEARMKTEDAIALMTHARSALDLLAREVGHIDFSAELAYIDKRTEALEAALETADALLAGNRDAASEANETYNELDREAAQLASTLPVSTSGQVRSRYAEEMKRLEEAYAAVRAQATTSDAVIRAYLR